MNILLFAHSLVSCWNHGNAHFLRGVARALIAEGHRVTTYEPQDAWSRANLVADGHLPAAFHAAYPELTSHLYGADLDLNEALDDADLVLVHEWNTPALVAQIGAHRIAHGGYTLLFHDTHHRAVTKPDAIRAFDLQGYDGVLAFGETLAQVYRRWGWGGRVHVWHEAADITHFHPPLEPQPRTGAVFIGNWGDDERAHELETFLLAPADAAGLPLSVHGVRYPPAARAALARHHAAYFGWLANAAAPAVFARHALTVHVPRRAYTQLLPGIPTIRVFEALACGIPLLSAPWEDSERLFRPGQDFLMPADGPAMARAMRDVANDGELAASLAASGLATIRARHTTAHRAAELLAIAAKHQPALADERRVAA